MQPSTLPMPESNMAFDVADVGSTVGAMRAGVWLLPGVGADVVLEVLSFDGPVGALRTLEHPFRQHRSTRISSSSSRAEQGGCGPSRHRSREGREYILAGRGGGSRCFNARREGGTPSSTPLKKRGGGAHERSSLGGGEEGTGIHTKERRLAHTKCVENIQVLK